MCPGVIRWPDRLVSQSEAGVPCHEGRHRNGNGVTATITDLRAGISVISATVGGSRAAL